MRPGIVDVLLYSLLKLLEILLGYSKAGRSVGGWHWWLMEREWKRRTLPLKSWPFCIKHHMWLWCWCETLLAAEPHFPRRWSVIGRGFPCAPFFHKSACRHMRVNECGVCLRSWDERNTMCRAERADMESFQWKYFNKASKNSWICGWDSVKSSCHITWLLDVSSRL